MGPALGPSCGAGGETPLIGTRWKCKPVTGTGLSAPAVLREKASCSSACLCHPAHARLESLRVSKPNGGGGQQKKKSMLWCAGAQRLRLLGFGWLWLADRSVLRMEVG